MTSGVENCYWSRLDSLAEEHGHTLASDLGFRDTGQVIVAILATDVGFSSFGCGTWTSVEPSSLGRVSSLSDGIWAVGSQVAPGTYMTSEVRNCGWSRLSGFSGGFADTIAGKMVDGQGIVEILATDVGFSSFDCGTWTFVTTSTTSQAPATTSTTS